jgi:hypothetical protein
VPYINKRALAGSDIKQRKTQSLVLKDRMADLRASM